MKFERERWLRLAYLFAAVIVTSAVAASWYVADRASTRTHLALAERNRALQVDLARNAMEESFSRLLEENRILSSYSFNEYERGIRDDASMVSLLEFESESYRESIAYAYFRGPGMPRFVEARQGTGSVVAALTQASSELWQGFGSGEAPVVLHGPSADPEPYFMFFYPVYVEGALKGVLGTAVGLGKAIDKYLSPLATGEGRRSFLMFGAGRILWASDDRKPTLFALDEGSLMTSRSFRLGSGEFTIIADESRSSLMADLNAVETPRTLVFSAGVLLLAAALFAASRVYLERGKRLVLAEEEKRLSERVAVRERELEESELRFRKLFDAANDGILIVDRSFKVVECNRGAERLYGRSAAEILGSSPIDFSPVSQPDGRASADAVLSILKEVSSGRSMIFEWTHSRGDGSSFDAEISVSPIRLGERVLYQAFIRDISERKRNDKRLHDALDDREILLRELHHRVKNNFQFLESLIELQKGEATEEVRLALAKIQSRTSALAAAYLITAERPESLRVDVREYLNVLSSQSTEAASVGARFDIVIECEDIPLSLDSAVSLGLLYREIVTNAMQHGYGEDKGGRIDVSFVRDGSQAALRVRDYGAGLPGGVEGKLGLTIVRALVLQLNGTIDLSAAAPGTLVEARFPLA
ncbi:MAG: PAS domain S-box protein [Spirochaetes bacterium]|nr:PAS domain S-box protein [Spirochaetota bacterium]MBU1079242.1 PAS domain S-box protein [Spirochaetota bacterium]